MGSDAVGMLGVVTPVLQALAPDGAEYAAATAGAALLDQSDRGKLALSGADAVEFLDSLLSQDIAAIAPGAGADATLLTPKGRLLAEVRVLRTDEELLLDCERIGLQALFDALMKFRIGYRVELHKRTLESALFSLVGPRVDELLQRPPPAEEFAHVASEVDGRTVRLLRSRFGVDLLCDSVDRDHVHGALEAAGAVAISQATFDCLRIESGVPRFGVEIDENTMPQEAGLHERAVSYSKGCYVGQETVARLYWKGKPNRLLRGLRLSEPVGPGTVLWQNERDVGALASVAASPRLGLIGLALLRREAEPGDILSVEGSAAAATVVELPFSV
jgi:folate-binding protein YgfZ